MPWDPMGECPCFTVLRKIILEGILLASRCTGKRRAVKHIYFRLLSTNWLPLLRALQLVNGDPSQVDLLYISCPRRRCTPAPARGRAHTHTHTHTSPIPNQEKGSDWPVPGQITSLNPNKHDMELGSRHPTGLQGPLHPAGEGTGCPCDLVRYCSESIIHVP